MSGADFWYLSKNPFELITILLLTASWRNGSASDSRSEGCVFKSRRGHSIFAFLLRPYKQNRHSPACQVRQRPHNMRALGGGEIAEMNVKQSSHCSAPEKCSESYDECVFVCAAIMCGMLLPLGLESWSVCSLSMKRSSPMRRYRQLGLLGYPRQREVIWLECLWTERWAKRGN